MWSGRWQWPIRLHEKVITINSLFRSCCTSLCFRVFSCLDFPLICLCVRLSGVGQGAFCTRNRNKNRMCKRAFRPWPSGTPNSSQQLGWSWFHRLAIWANSRQVVLLLLGDCTVVVRQFAWFSCELARLCGIVWPPADASLILEFGSSWLELGVPFGQGFIFVSPCFIMISRFSVCIPAIQTRTEDRNIGIVVLDYGSSQLTEKLLQSNPAVKSTLISKAAGSPPRQIDTIQDVLQIVKDESILMLVDLYAQLPRDVFDQVRKVDRVIFKTHLSCHSHSACVVRANTRPLAIHVRRFTTGSFISYPASRVSLPLLPRPLLQGEEMLLAGYS